MGGGGPRHSGVVIKTSPEKSIPGPSLLLEDHDSGLSQPIKFICVIQNFIRVHFRCFLTIFGKLNTLLQKTELLGSRCPLPPVYRKTFVYFLLIIPKD